jgi:branched-subunit amino acid transport protein
MLGWKQAGGKEMKLDLLLLILGMSVVTYIPRALPFFTKLDIERYGFLKFIPVAVFASLVSPLLFVEFDPDRTAAAFFAVIVAYKTKRMLLTIFIGVALLYLFTRLRLFGF